MINIKEILEEIEFKKINELINNFENETERLEFANILSGYKYSILSDKEKEKEIKLKLLDYINKQKYSSDILEDKKIKFSLLQNQKLENLRRFYIENQNIDKDLSLEKVDPLIEKLDIKSKKIIQLNLDNIQKAESKKQSISFDVDYSLLPRNIRMALIPMAEYSIKEITEDKIIYNLKFKKNLNFKDYKPLFDQIDHFLNDRNLDRILDLFSEKNLKELRNIKTNGITSFDQIKNFGIPISEESFLYKKIYGTSLPLSRDFCTYIDDLYVLSLAYYDEIYGSFISDKDSQTPQQKANDIDKAAKQETNKILSSIEKVRVMNENLLKSIKRSGIISLSTNIDLSRKSIFNEFSKYGINDINLINKFIEENTIDPQTVEENKVIPMKDKIIVSEIDRVYKETREKPVKPENQKNPVKPEKSEEPKKPEKSEEPEEPEEPKKPEKSEKPEEPEEPEEPKKLEKPENPENSKNPEKSEEPKKPEKSEEPEEPEEPKKPEKSEKPEEPEEPKKLEKPENPENSKNPEKSENTEKSEKSEKSEKPKVKVIKPSKNPNDKNS